MQKVYLLCTIREKGWIWQVLEDVSLFVVWHSNRLKYQFGTSAIV